MELNTLFSILILIMSVVVHEVSHGMAAHALGDPTARLEGRLTLNPLKHLDLFGSILLPFLLIVTRAPFVVGWAKPVPYNPERLRNRRWGEALVAGAGPASNLLIALVFGTLIRTIASALPPSFVELAAATVLINIALAIFNLVPIPPLDGSKILFSFFAARLPRVREFLERNWLGFLFIFIFLLWDLLFPLVRALFRLFTGLHL